MRKCADVEISGLEEIIDNQINYEGTLLLRENARASHSYSRLVRRDERLDQDQPWQHTAFRRQTRTCHRAFALHHRT